MAGSGAGGTVLYVGTYTRGAQGRAEGIYVCRFDRASGAVSVQDTVKGIDNPSFLALDPAQRYLYAVGEVQHIQGQPGGGVNAYAVDPATGGLTLLNSERSIGSGPCHLVVDNTGQYVLVANYGSGSVAMLPVQRDGRLGAASDFHQHEGSSVDQRRQEGPHAHSVTLSPDNRFALVADLGLDQVLVYRLDLAQGKLVPNDPPSAATKPGAGPRHMAFHPNGHYVYAINELGSTMTTFAYDAERGTLRELQTLSTLPAGFGETTHCADVHVAPSGRFVYGSNRGHDSIAVFRVNEGDGTLTELGHTPTGGRTPRNFAIDPTGSFLLAANQNSDNVVTFHIDQTTGGLTPTGQVASVPSPVCLQFAPAVG